MWVSDCEICGVAHRECQTDHIKGGFGFNDWSSFTDWAKMILWVTFEDIRELCPECHAAVTLSQRLGISFEEASREKKAIALQKSKEDFQFIEEYGRIPAKSKEKRRKQIIEILEEMENEKDD